MSVCDSCNVDYGIQTFEIKSIEDTGICRFCRAKGKTWTKNPEDVPEINTYLVEVPEVHIQVYRVKGVSPEGAISLIKTGNWKEPDGINEDWDVEILESNFVFSYILDTVDWEVQLEK